MSPATGNAAIENDELEELDDGAPKGIPRIAWIGVATLTLLFGAGPVLVHLLRPVSTYSEDERQQVDARWSSLAAGAPTATRSSGDEAQLDRLLELVREELGTAAHSGHLPFLSRTGTFHVRAAGPTGTPETLEPVVRDVLAWHRGELEVVEATDGSLADEHLHDALETWRDLGVLLAHSIELEPEVWDAALHLAHELRRSSDLSLAAAGYELVVVLVGELDLSALQRRPSMLDTARRYPVLARDAIDALVRAAVELESDIGAALDAGDIDSPQVAELIDGRVLIGSKLDAWLQNQKTAMRDDLARALEPSIARSAAPDLQGTRMDFAAIELHGVDGNPLLAWFAHEAEQLLHAAERALTVWAPIAGP